METTNMKKITKIYSVMVFFLMLGSLMSVQIGNAQERGFFDNTLDYDTQYFKFKDYTCSTVEITCYFIISVKINTNTEHLSVLDAKDLFIQIKVYQQDLESKILQINIADVYVEQVIDGGRYGGVPFDQSSAFIGDHELPQISAEIPYNYHIGLDGCDTDACISYREGAANFRSGSWFTHLQINLEVQLYIDIPSADGVDRYQDYIYIGINDQLQPIQHQASQSMISGFEFIHVLIAIPILIAGMLLFRKNKKQ